MTQQNQKLPIRSRDDRARDDRARDLAARERVSLEESSESSDKPDSSSNVSSNGAGNAGSDSLAEVREQAHSLGYSIRREPRPRRPSPEPKDGRVSTTCRLYPEVRAAMDQARLELNLNYSDMINAGIVMFLESRNLRGDVNLQQFLPPG